MNKFPTFIKTERTLPCSQKPTSGAHAETENHVHDSNFIYDPTEFYPLLGQF
jgi:hypothetical protein